MSARLEADINTDANTMEGKIDITSGDCDGTTYSITTTQTGSADVTW
jgi:hypothetical protein